MEGKRARLFDMDAVKAIAMIYIVMFHACTVSGVTGGSERSVKYGESK